MNTAERIGRFRLSLAVMALLVTTVVGVAQPASALAAPCATQMARGANINPQSISPNPRVTVASTSRADIIDAIDQIQRAGGGTLHFPAGNYTIPFDPRGSSGVGSYLTFRDVGDVKITGVGNNTVLRLEAHNAFKGSTAKVLRVLGASRVEIANFRLIGQRDFVTPNGVPTTGELAWEQRNPRGASQSAFGQIEQQNLVHLREVRQSTYLHDLNLSHSAGDGINVAGMSNIVMKNNTMDDFGRNGITIGGERGRDQNRNILIQGNTFGSGIDTQQIDVELHGDIDYRRRASDLNSNFQIKDNMFRRQSPVDTIDEDQWAMTIVETDKVLLSGNTIQNPMQQRFSTNVLFTNNPEIAGLLIARTGSTEIVGNTFKLVNHPFYQGGLRAEERRGDRPELVILRNNQFSSRGVPDAVVLENIDRGFVENNNFGSMQGAQHHLSLISSGGRSVVNESGNGLSSSQRDVQVRGSGSMRLTENPQNCSGGSQPAPAPTATTTTTTTRPPQPAPAPTTTTTTRPPQPAPATPTPADPAPATPTPADPAPATPTPADPAPRPAPASPTPADPAPTAVPARPAATTTTTTAPAATPARAVQTGLRCDGKKATIVGTPGDDILIGTDGADVIVALGGNDRIIGGDGGDTICAGAGNDYVNAGRGADTVFGQAGRDRIRGGTGQDQLDGGNQRDRIRAGMGDDNVAGGRGIDRAHGGPGDDRIHGGGGSDLIYGGPNNDILTGGIGDDWIDGGSGVDSINGGAGQDIIVGVARQLRSPD